MGEVSGGGLDGRYNLVMKIQLEHRFEDIVSVENLLEAWQELIKGKRSKKDVQEFSFHLMDNILELHRNLSIGSYRHGGYTAFNISDPKPRNIHKAPVRDRLLHHAIYRILYPFFDRTFIADSYSCRISKGTHKAINQFRRIARKVSRNDTRTCWILKCDIKRFFENIDHEVLKDILRKHISGERVIWLLSEVIGSFSSRRERIGLPLGNLTSQLFVNVYMNEFDQFVKHRLKARHYLRYADDFVILSENREWLESVVIPIQKFLKDELKLELHSDKVFIKSLASGVDFLGWVHFPDHRVLRTTTKRRMLKRVREHPGVQTLFSYFGLLRHGNAGKLQTELTIFGEVVS